MQKRLFAFFVGINKYQHPTGFSTLSGAESDAQRMDAFIREINTDFDYQPQLLLGSEATRANIIQGIRTHLGQANSDDVALFYFSGHGLRERAPLAFHDPTSTVALESIACYDSYTSDSLHGLANKELRYLLHQAAGNHPHLAVITDCCHSATATRGGLSVQRRSAAAEFYEMLPTRNWQHFLFAGELSGGVSLTALELDTVLPHAAHLHLAACMAEQSAYEVSGQGLFTSHVLEVLRQSGGAVSYTELRDRVDSLLHSRTVQYQQTPSIYTPRGSLLADAAFLGMNRLKSKVTLTVTVGENNIRINRGLIHGIPESNNQDGIEINIYEKDNPALGEVASAIVWHTGLTTSEIRLVGTANLRRNGVYEGQIHGLYQRDFNVALYSADSECLGRQSIKSAFRQAFQKEIAEIPASNTDCIVVLHANRITLAHPDSDYASFDENKYLPLAKQLDGYSPENISEVIRYLQKIAQYQATRNITNKNSSLLSSSYPLKIGLGSGDVPTSWATWNEVERCYDINLVESMADTPMINMFLQVTNRSSNICYFSLMYMSQLFAIYPNLLDDSAMSLSIDPGRNTERMIPFMLEQYILDFNQPFEKGLFRLFVSLEAFSLNGMGQRNLPAPQIAIAKGDASGNFMNITPPVRRTGWIIVDYPVRVINPRYSI